MSKYRKKPVIVEAHQWFKNGDHPEVEDIPNIFKESFTQEVCEGEQCGKELLTHGWANDWIPKRLICPGDWIIKDEDGDYSVCDPDEFKRIYEKVAKQP